MKLKLVYQKNVKRYELPEVQLYESLLALVRSTYHLASFQLKYMDDEDDEITITSEVDVTEAAQQAEKAGTVLKIFIQSVGGLECHDEAVKDENTDEWVQFPADEKVEQGNQGNDGLFDWEEVCEDFLANQEIQQATEKAIDYLYSRLQKGQKLSKVVVDILKESPFVKHPFVQMGLQKMEYMLAKADNYGFVLLQAGKEGIGMAFPGVLRGFAKYMKNGDNGGPVLVDMANIFKQLFPQWFTMLASAVPNGQTVDVSLADLFSCPSAQPGQVTALDPEMAEAEKEGIIIHKGVTCDICENGPIIGPRYKCLQCPNFDMCDTCQATGAHQANHPILKMNKPAPRQGFDMGRGKFPGMSEMFQPPWMRRMGGAKESPRRHKRRAMKKWFKAQKKWCKEGGNEQEGSIPGPPWRRPCGPVGPGGFWRRFMSEQRKSDQRKRSASEDEDVDVSDFTDSSSSSDSDASDEEMCSPKLHKPITDPKRLNCALAKGEKKRKCLAKKLKKSRKKVRKVEKMKAKIDKKLKKALRKRAHDELALKNHKAKMDALLRMPKKEVLRVPKATVYTAMPSANVAKVPTAPPSAMDVDVRPSRIVLEEQKEEPQPSAPRPPAEEAAPFAYDNHMRTLKEMGFVDIKLNKQLLNSKKGDIRGVFEILMSLSKEN